MPFLHTYDLAQSVSFRRRLTPCIAKVAGIVLQTADTGKYSLDLKRKELARTVLRDPELASNQFIWPVLSNVSIAGAGLDATDGDIEYQVGEIWNVVAGVNQNDIEAPSSLDIPEPQ